MFAWPNPKKRKEVLVAFSNLRVAILRLPPTNLNVNHPNFPEIEAAMFGMEGLLIGTNKKDVRCCSLLDFGTKALVGMGKNLIVHDFVQSRTILDLQGHKGTVNCCAVFSDDSRAVSGSDDKTLRVWNLTTRVTLKILAGHAAPVNFCAVSNNDTKIVSCATTKPVEGFLDCLVRIYVANQKDIRVWDMDSGSTQQTIEACCNGIAVPRKGGACMVLGNTSTSTRKSLSVWGMKEGEKLHRIPVGSEGNGCAFAQLENDTHVLANGGRKLSLWDLSTQKLKGAYDVGYPAPTTQEGVGTVVLCSVLDNEEKAVVVILDNPYRLRLWDLQSDRLDFEQRLDPKISSWHDLSVSSDGSRVVLLGSSKSERHLQVVTLP